MSPKEKISLGSLQYKRIRVAQDPPEDEGPTEEELVDEFEDTPQANWKEFEQLIIRMLQSQYNTPVTLVGTKIEAPYGNLDAGFNIKGFLKFPKGRPLSILEKFEEAPIVFRAYIADGELIEPIELDFE